MAALPLGFLGLPSVQEIVEGIANGFAQALAGALVPGFLKHASVATIQWLVALPDPESWTHVRHLQGEMTWLGISLLPVTVTVGTLRCWVLGIGGSGDPSAILVRAAGACGVLVAYPWVVSQVVAAANTTTHAILGFPEVANGLASLVTVLFGGALLIGAGSAFAAVLVIVGVVFAGALFAIQAFLVLLLAFLIVGGPLAIALWPIPEMAALARLWARALAVVALVPVCWTVLFATAGAFTLDATDLSGGAGGLPGHITAAFAALATWILAVRLPMMLLGELRGLLAGGLHPRGAGGAAAGGSSGLPGAQRLRLAQVRLRAGTLDGVPALAGSVGMAAGALGAPQGGAVGALRRRAGRVRSGGAAEGAAGSAGAGGRDGGLGLRGRVAEAGRILRDAPGQARVATGEGVAAEMARGEGRAPRAGRGGKTAGGVRNGGAQAQARRRPERTSQAQPATVQGGGEATRASGDPRVRPAGGPTASAGSGVPSPAGGAGPGETPQPRRPAVGGDGGHGERAPSGERRTEPAGGQREVPAPRAQGPGSARRPARPQEREGGSRGAEKRRESDAPVPRPKERGGGASSRGEPPHERRPPEGRTAPKDDGR